MSGHFGYSFVLNLIWDVIAYIITQYGLSLFVYSILPHSLVKSLW